MITTIESPKETLLIKNTEGKIIINRISRLLNLRSFNDISILNFGKVFL